MSKCLFCDKDVPQKDGKRAKLFCNGNCRNKYYYKKDRQDKPPKPVGRPKKPTWTTDTKLEKLDKKEYGKLVVVTDKKPPKTAQVPIASINRSSHGMAVQKVKESCPFELQGINRTIWIHDKLKEEGLK